MAAAIVRTSYEHRAMVVGGITHRDIQPLLSSDRRRPPLYERSNLPCVPCFQGQTQPAHLAQTCLYVVRADSQVDCRTTPSRAMGYLCLQKHAMPKCCPSGEISARKYLSVIIASVAFQVTSGWSALAWPCLGHHAMTSVPFTLPLSILAVLEPN
jgi:hypothetical protein